MANISTIHRPVLDSVAITQGKAYTTPHSLPYSGELLLRATGRYGYMERYFTGVLAVTESLRFFLLTDYGSGNEESVKRFNK